MVFFHRWGSARRQPWAASSDLRLFPQTEVQAGWRVASFYKLVDQSLIRIGRHGDGELRKIYCLPSLRRIAACIYGVLPDRNPGFRPTYSATLVLNPTRINDRTVQEQRYLDAALTCAERNHWQLGPKLRNADDQCVGQAYLEIFLLRKGPITLAGTQARFEQIRAAPRWGTEYGWEQGTNWAWCDALFMAAPTLARLARATGDTAYLTLMNRMWWEPYAFTDDLACTKRISRKHRIRPIRLSTIYVSE